MFTIKKSHYLLDIPAIYLQRDCLISIKLLLTSGGENNFQSKENILSS